MKRHSREAGLGRSTRETGTVSSARIVGAAVRRVDTTLTPKRERLTR